MPASNSKMQLEEKLESTLKDLNLLDEKDALTEEQKMLSSFPTNITRKKIKELSKNRNLMFYSELKQKRIAKIKSKLYHKIKKKVHLIKF